MWPLEVRLTDSAHSDTTLFNLLCLFCVPAWESFSFLFFARFHCGSMFFHALVIHLLPADTYLACTVWQQLQRLHGWHAAPKVHRLSYSGAARVSQPQTDASRHLKEISGSRAPNAHRSRRQRHCSGPWCTAGSRRSHVPQPMQQARSTRILCSSHTPTPCFL